MQKLNQNLLKYALENHIIDTDSVLDMIMKTKRNAILEKHPYAITAPSSKSGRWQTCVKDACGKRKNIKAQTKDELLDKLYSYYTEGNSYEFEYLFNQWLTYKTTITNSPNTITRHKQHYKKYLLHSKLHQLKLSQIDELVLETECNRLVKENNLSRKEFTNVKTILKGMFNYALRKKYIDTNPMDNVEIHVKYRQVCKKTGKTETYNTEELNALNSYLDSRYAETKDISFMAVKLNFFLGLRVGELVALKWEDYIDLTHLHIRREEVRLQETNTFEVVEHTKTNTDRFVVLVPKAIKILQSLPKNGEYIFMRDGTRLTARQVAYVLEKYAKCNGVKTKSTHKMRKTYASRLSSSGVPLDAIREQLGHSNLSTTLGYIYNPLTEKETYSLISKAL